MNDRDPKTVLLEKLEVYLETLAGFLTDSMTLTNSAATTSYPGSSMAWRCGEYVNEIRQVLKQ